VRVLKGHRYNAYGCAFSPNGRHIASVSSDKRVRVWRVEDGKCVADLEGHSTYVYWVTWSPDGQRVASASQDTTVRVWTPFSKPPRCVCVFAEHMTTISACAFHPSGQMLASACQDGKVRLWKVPDITNSQRSRSSSRSNSPFRRENSPGLEGYAYEEKPHDTLTGHIAEVSCLDFSPSGRFLASSSWDNTIRIWTLAPSRSRGLINSLSRGIGKPPEGSGGGRANAIDSPTVRATRWRSSATLRGHKDWVLCCAFPAKGVGQQNTTRSLRNPGRTSQTPEILASSSRDGTVRLWQYRGCMEGLGHRRGLWDCVRIFRKAPRDRQGWSMVPLGIALSQDARVVIAGYSSGLRAWSTERATMAVLQGHKSTVQAVCINTNGSLAATASLDSDVRLWKLLTVQHIETELQKCIPKLNVVLPLLLDYVCGPPRPPFTLAQFSEEEVSINTESDDFDSTTVGESSSSEADLDSYPVCRGRSSERDSETWAEGQLCAHITELWNTI